MRTQPTSAHRWPEEITLSDGVLVASGYGLRISVFRGRLRVDDGLGSARRSVLLHRATSRLKRLVVTGHSGSVSLAALRWLAEVKAAYVQVDGDGRVLAANGPLGTDRPSLRRAQAKALGSPAGLEIARGLIREKIAGQRAVLGVLADRVPAKPEVLGAIDAQHEVAALVRTANELRVCEAKAASAYWSAWSQLPITFGRRDALAVPSHWRIFGTRSSPLSSGPRLAINPANALANYLYNAILESEATIACCIVGLDPGLGIFHVDQDNRESLAADLMEPIRPIVDRYLLDLLERHTFAASDFYETSTGVCRLTSSLARQLWSIAPEIGIRAGRVAEEVAAQLDGRTARTPITGRRRQDARPFGRLRGTSAHLDPPTNRSCRWCGTAMDGDRLICDGCAPDWRQVRDAKFIDSGPRRLASLRELGNDPTKTSGALEKNRQSRIRRHLEQLAWESANPGAADPDEFRREILPDIQRVSVRRLAAVTGLSLGYCGRIRRGETVPHPRWWECLRNTTAQTVRGAPSQG